MDIGLIKRACLRQLKFRGLLYFLYGSMIAIPLFMAAMYYDLGKWDILMSVVVGYGFAFILLCFQIGRFFRLVRRQERQYGICFSDRNAKPLQKYSPGLLVDDWFILAGIAAFYCGYVKEITWQYERYHYGWGVGRYYLIVKTTDGRQYRLPLDAKSNCAKVRRWWKSKTGENIYGI